MHLNLGYLRRLDEAIIQHYEQWINAAPGEYREDGFFVQRRPIAITSRYGQNQELGLNEETEMEEGLNWQRDRDFSRVRYISVAIATHLR